MGYGEGSSGPVEEESVLREVRTQFTPEFLNRVDEVVLFKSLSPESLHRIVDLQLEDLTARLAHQGKALLLDPEARDLIAREGYSFEYGARNLGRVLRRRILEPMADLALTNDWDRSTAVRVSLDGEGLSVGLLFENGGVVLETAGQERESESERDG
jgi:ATP-dependent Clp protease ATP-binding subunit ClpA